MFCLARVMVKLAMITGWKSSILGYMSRGERVPLVITTLWNRSKSYNLKGNDEVLISRNLPLKKEACPI